MLAVLFALPFAAVLAADRLPSGSTHKDVLVATVQDAGKPYPLRANIYLPRDTGRGVAYVKLTVVEDLLIVSFKERDA